MSNKAGYNSHQNPTEINILFSKLRNCDPKDKESIEYDLFEKLSCIPKGMARKMSWARNRHDILYSGYLGLLKCIRWFDFSKCNNFFLIGPSYVIKEIEREKKKEGMWNVVFFENYVGIDEIIDTHPTDEESIEINFIKRQFECFLADAIESLDKKSKKIIRRVYGFDGKGGISLRDFAVENGMPIAKVLRQHKNAIFKIKVFVLAQSKNRAVKKSC